MPPQHLILIPAFNEERTIGRVVAAARGHGPVAVVDDGSTDGTSARADAAGGMVVAHGHRRGKGEAIRSGAALARRMGVTWMLTLDGDGQHDPAAIPLLLATAQRAPTAIVIAGRLGHTSGMPRVRLLACRAAGFVINRLTGYAIQDTQSGFRCYPVRLFEEIGCRSGGFVLETEILVAAAGAGWNLLEVEVAATHRAGRPSRLHPFTDGVAIGGFLAGRVLTRWARLSGSRALAPARVAGGRDLVGSAPPREFGMRRGKPAFPEAREVGGRR